MKSKGLNKLVVRKLLTKGKKPTLVVEVERLKSRKAVPTFKKVVDEDRRNFFFKS